MNVRIGGLDGLRAISIVLVFLFHAAHLPGFPDSGVLRSVAKIGSNGVSVFFIISGFLITWLILKAEANAGAIQLATFYKRRALRILPPAFFYLGVLAILGVTTSLQVTFGEILSCVLFVRNFGSFSPLGENFTQIFWTLSIEEQFYLCWPVYLIVTPHHRRIAGTLILCLLAPVWRQLNMELVGGDNINWFRTDLRYDFLLWGCLLALIHDSQSLKATVNKLLYFPNATFIAAVTALLLLWFPPIQFPGYIAAVAPTLGSMLTALIVLLSIERRSRIADVFLNFPPLVWLGRLSYSLYLWHGIFCYQTVWPSLRPLPVVLALSFATAMVSYYAIELPALRLRDRFLTKRASVSGVPVAPRVN